jgi:tagaturonate epimerase
MLENLKPLDGFDIYPRSSVSAGGATYFMVQECATLQKYLGVSGANPGFTQPARQADGYTCYPLTPANAALLRSRLPWMQPQPGGLRTSFGFGDRLGLASGGHALAAWEAKLFPVFAQQSVRENQRTGRTPQQVLDEAMWGIFQLGWGKPWGADADHLKSVDDLEEFVQAGYTFYTVDPGDLVDDSAGSASLKELKELAARLPWEALHSSPQEAYRLYLDRPLEVDGGWLHLDEPTLLRALAKYGSAVAHAVRMYRALEALFPGAPFDFEVSVDETQTPTTPAEHYIIASQLQRLGVRFTSLAPRFPGRFEKSVDYIGDLGELETALVQHAAILRHFGSYKLSLHSGSDKFSAYPLLAQHAGTLVHVKTAGTSYLEALRVVAQVEPAFFREILELARQRYPQERASYHVSAQEERVPAAESLPDAGLPALLDDFHTRQVLHVTYGAVLERYGKQLKTLLATFEPEYAAGLQRHFGQHLEAFL